MTKILYLGAILFLGGLAYTAFRLIGFERQLRHEWQHSGARRPDRRRVGATLRALIASGLVSGVGIGLLGISAFIWGRTGPPGVGAYVWAALFVIVAVVGWAAIVVMAFMARVNAIERYFQK